MSANGKHTKKGDVIDLAGDQGINLATEPDFRLGELLIRPSSRAVVLNDRSEMLEPRVLQVLIVLARRRGDVVSREQLVETCWGGRVVSEDAVNRSITKVRRWSGPKTFTLETIPRVGYRLVVAPNPVVASPAAPIKPVITAKSGRYSTRKKVFLILGACFALFVISMSWYGIQYWRDSNRPYFAVLHFDVVETDAEAVALAEAISTAINLQLTEQGFRVVSPALSSQYRGTRKSEASMLGSRYVIDGSVHREGTQLRVAARVDATVKPMTVWSREFDIDLTDAGVLPDKIGVVLAGLFNPAMQSNPMVSPEVTAGMLRINALRFQGKDMDAYIAAKELLRANPTHYTPQIWYANVAADTLDLWPSGERAAVLDDARQATERAARVVWGSLPTLRSALTPTVEWSVREHLLREAILEELWDGANTRYVISAMLVSSGQIDEAIEQANRAVVMYPLAARHVVAHASALDVAGRREQADKVLESAERLWPKTEFVERLRFGSAIARGDLVHASALLQDPVIGRLLDPPAEHRPYATILRALATHEADDIAEVERDCADPAKLARDRATLCLQGLIALGRLDTFFDVAPAYFPEQRGATAADRDARWLEAPRVGRYVRVLFRADTKAVRTDPRFIPIAERLGLIDYWRSSGKWPDFCKTEPESVCSNMRALQP